MTAQEAQAHYEGHANKDSSFLSLQTPVYERDPRTVLGALLQSTDPSMIVGNALEGHWQQQVDQINFVINGKFERVMNLEELESKSKSDRQLDSTFNNLM